ncbi:MAG TPA: response regulator transcription factor [Prolixibacteraceae bacterium]|nr:response regulator transcription factor [Prolixibacteraceae bacterium]
MTLTSTIKILISYDQQLVAEGLASILLNQKDIRVNDLFENNSFWDKKILDYQADILIIEFHNWYSKHFEYIKRIHEHFPELKLLILSDPITHYQLDKIMQNIHGYILKTCSSETVIFAIREIFGSGKYLCSREIDIIFGSANNNESELELTIREKEILANWLTSKDNNELAEKLNISYSTVRTHIKNIRQKLGAVTHAQLMNFACRENIRMGNYKPVCENCKSCLK